MTEIAAVQGDSMPAEGQEQLDSRALELSVEARTLITQHIDTCNKRYEEEAAERREAERRLNTKFDGVSESFRRLHDRFDKMNWAVIGLLITVVLALIGAFATAKGWI